MFAKIIEITAVIMAALTALFAVLYEQTSAAPSSALLTLAITFGTISYHFIMRLAVGFAINSAFHNKMDYNKKWFREKKFEKRLYEILRVKKWKDKMPTFAPEMLDIKQHSWEEIAGAMCQSEVVHSIIAVLSLLPILAALVWGSFWVFFITSIVSAIAECMFVIMQRFNRPRIVRHIERKKGSVKK